MSAGVNYRVLVSGQQHFDCAALRATLSTQACAARWQSAAPGTQCHECEIGQAHHRQHHRQPDLPATPRRAGEGACLRCGRTDLRLVRGKTLCVSCFNREGEWRKGRSARGTPPRHYKPPHSIQMAVCRSDGAVEYRRIQALHGTEAACLASRRLAPGESLADGDEAHPGATAWNAAAQRFVYACRRCSTPGLLEHVNAVGRVRYRCPTCGADPAESAAWQIAQVRGLPMALSPAELVAWLDASEPGAPASRRWAATEFVCAGCRTSPLTVRRASDQWQVRCPACQLQAGVQ